MYAKPLSCSVNLRCFLLTSSCSNMAKLFDFSYMSPKVAVHMKYYVYRKIPECIRSLWSQSFINKILIRYLHLLWQMIHYNLKIKECISKKYKNTHPTTSSQHIFHNKPPQNQFQSTLKNNTLK